MGVGGTAILAAINPTVAALGLANIGLYGQADKIKHLSQYKLLKTNRGSKSLSSSEVGNHVTYACLIAFAPPESLFKVNNQNDK